MSITDEYIISYFYTKSKTRIVPERLLNISDDIKTYLDNRFNDSLSYIETIQRLKLGINEHPKCICGKPVKYIGGSKVFLQSCGCDECAKRINALHVKETSLKRYGVSNPAKDNNVKQKQKQTNIERYGCECALQNNNVKEKTKQTNIRKYGCEIAQQSDNVKTKIAKSNKETVKQKYGVDNIAKLDIVKEKCKYTLKQKYGVEGVLSVEQFRNKYILTNVAKYGVKYPSQNEEIKKRIRDSFYLHMIRKYGVKYPSQNEEIKRRIQASYKQTIHNRYGVNNVSELPDVVLKIQQTKRENNTFNKSSDEEIIYQNLINIYGTDDIIRQYRSEKYPFNCDFYIKSLDLYIEYNGTWTHGGHPYDETNKDDLTILQNWKNKKTKYYDNAINIWTVRDVNKRKTALENNLNYIEIWNLDVFFTYILQIEENSNVLYNEYLYYTNAHGKLSNITQKNNIIKYFQQDTFFGTEKNLYWHNLDIQKKLFNNRYTYLKKDSLSTLDLLNGFKISGLHYGYSHFNPLLFKWFIETYNIKTCYDPCGGWGHRLLGSSDLDLYIYNDLSKQTKENVDRIISYFDIQNTITYCEDANTFRPTETYQAMFTCPPYFNVEHYECGDFETINDYYKFIDNLFDCFYKSNAHVFGLVIREDCLEDKWKHTAKDKYELNVSKSHLIKTKRYKEYLYIFEK